LRRLELASASPIFSHFSESQTGVSTIRAYKAETRFIRIMQNYVDENQIFKITTNLADRWLAISKYFNTIKVFYLIYSYYIFIRNGHSMLKTIS
jgi:hypothetical protein